MERHHLQLNLTQRHSAGLFDRLLETATKKTIQLEAARAVGHVNPQHTPAETHQRGTPDKRRGNQLLPEIRQSPQLLTRSFDVVPEVGGDKLQCQVPRTIVTPFPKATKVAVTGVVEDWRQIRHADHSITRAVPERRV